MGLWEILVIVVILLLFAGSRFPNLRQNLRRGLDEFGKASDEVRREMGLEAPLRKSEITIWLAQGFGVGRIPFAPGTFGSVVGLVWFLILLLPKSPLFFVLGIVASIFVSVWLCGAGEKILNQRDPGSIVMDEIIAIPICFGSWLAFLFFQKGFWPAPEYFFSENKLADDNWRFRFVPPVRRRQTLASETKPDTSRRLGRDDR